MEMIFATCGSNLEDLLFDELKDLGIKDLKKGFRGVYAPKTMANVYLINYYSRIATRVLWPLLQFHCRNKDDLYQKVAQYPWARWIKGKDTFAIDANVHHTNFRNSLYAVQVTKDGVCDSIKKENGTRPSINTASPSVQLNLFLNEKTCLLSFDTSGQPLFKRGYRLDTVDAPLQESLAAALLKFANYSPSDILCDPFCGSGTILIEAAMKHYEIPSGFLRSSFGFSKMPMHDSKVFEEIKKRFPRKEASSLLIQGNDKDSKAIALTKINLEQAELLEKVKLSTKDIAGYFPEIPPTLIITNPPYGVRLAVTERLYQDLASFIKRKCAPNVRAYILTTEVEALKTSGLTIKAQTPLVNGGVAVELVEVLP